MKDEFGGEIIQLAGAGNAPAVDEFGSPIIQHADQAPQGSGGPLQGLKDLAKFGMRQIDRVSAGPLRGAEEGIQNYQPEGDGSFHPGVIAAALKGAGRGIANPDQVQPAGQMFARMGASDAPSSQLQVMGTNGQPMSLGQDRPAGDPSAAATLGAVQDMIAPGPPVAAAIRSGKAAFEASKDAAKMGATKAILSHYSPPRLAQYAQKLGTFGNEADAVQAVADNLKANDLLYTPGKANFNLEKAQSSIGGQIGATIKEAKANNVAVNPQSVLDAYATMKEKILAESGKGVGTSRDFVKEVLPEIQGMIDDLKPNALGQVPIDKGVSFRQALQDMVKKWEGTTKAPLMQQVAKELQSSMNQEILKSDAVFGPKLAALNKKYSDLANAEVLISPAYNKSLGNVLSGKSGSVLQNAAGLVKHPIESLASPMQSAMKINPRLAEKIANGAE